MYRIKFNLQYLIVATIIFIIEILIALYAHDRFVRPYLGDFLVVILLYCFLKSFVHIPVSTAAILVLIFSYFIETLQYLDIVHRLGLQNSRVAKTVIGTSFEWVDLVAYTLGISTVLIVEKLRVRKGHLSKK